MRITKKFAGASCIGKQVYQPSEEMLSSDHSQLEIEELSVLEVSFYRRVGDRTNPGNLPWLEHLQYQILCSISHCNWIYLCDSNRKALLYILWYGTVQYTTLHCTVRVMVIITDNHSNWQQFVLELTRFRHWVRLRYDGGARLLWEQRWLSDGYGGRAGAGHVLQSI